MARDDGLEPAPARLRAIAMALAADERVAGVRALAPGLMLVGVIAAASAFVSEHHGGPAMLFALLIGIAFHFTMEPGGKCRPGVEFAGKRLLRLGVALLGARVTVEHIAGLGPWPPAVVLVCVAATIALGLLVARAMRAPWKLGMLTSGAVAICGASAALAIAAALEDDRPEAERDTLFTVIAVTTLSTLAMIVYPILFTGLGLGPSEIGVLLGATIHDVAQVVGAGYALSDTAGDSATYVKLMRVALLPIVVIALTILIGGLGRGAGRSFPWFAVGFLGLLVANSVGLVPEALRAVLEEASRWLLLVAIAALGVKTSVQAMTAAPRANLVLVVSETLFLATLATVLVMLFL